VSLRVGKGTLHSVIGSNGAGKTTLFNLLTGYRVPTSGRITFQGKDITHLPAHKISMHLLSNWVGNWNLILGAIFIGSVLTMRQGVFPVIFSKLKEKL